MSEFLTTLAAYNTVVLGDRLKQVADNYIELISLKMYGINLDNFLQLM